MLIKKYPQLNNWFIGLWYINQEWFRQRLKLTKKEQVQLYRAFERANSGLREIEKVFWRKQRAAMPEGSVRLQSDFVSRYGVRQSL